MTVCDNYVKYALQSESTLYPSRHHVETMSCVYWDRV